MQQVLEVFPGARRALFRRYHIGGCSSCAFDPTETLQELCLRNNNLEVNEVIEHLESSHEADEKIRVPPGQVAQWLEEDLPVRLVDIRSRQEYEAARIEGSLLLSQETMQEIMGGWNRQDRIVIIDHEGKQGLDAAAYFSGHGFTSVHCLRGGIDAWSQEVDATIPRYQFA
jgi:rhodanese-related sulfurtransferase